MVKLKDVNDTIAMDQVWHAFSVAHDIKINYFITLKVLKGGVFKTTIFDYIMTELVKRCPQHSLALTMIDE
jgi:hypothetical protein